ncbi:DUF4105 domain-containing protein [Salinisphaera sp. Q1T1-3]|uniref:Lnb N-terminal periplasmic domain-containing protein n=1 Tax=Salinisphaera sp. Q1T1-3 TaxID=2321229 RepID=UPI001F2EF84C|nr:DUF4105 domain-containing protein [Salinisphaera sp. Q1T1-3]
MIRLGAGTAGLVLTGYGLGALTFRGPRQRPARYLLITIWLGLAGAGLAGFATGGDIGPLLFVVATIVLLIWWACITPRQDRDWAPDVARQLGVQRHGDIVELDNVRHFVWRTRQDFTPGWEKRTFNAATIVGVDLAVSYWAGPNIAHTLVAFAFADGRHLCFSVEVRRLDGEHFSAIGGLFRQCELVLVAADERDILRTRTNIRGEHVHLYRVGLPPGEARALFHAYLDTAERLQRRPRFYNTLTANCTTLIYDMVKPIVPGLPWNWRLIVSGRLPSYLYALGALDTRLSLAELRRRGWINARALAWDRDAGPSADDFSAAIRRGLPAPEGWPVPPP